MIKTVIGTGFRGACQGALSAAFLNDIKIDGYAPKDFKLPHGIQLNLKSLGLKESKEIKLKPVIETNIKSADAVLFFIDGEKSKLEMEIYKIVIGYNKPYLEINMTSPIDQRLVRNFIHDVKGEKLYVTGKIDPKYSDKIYKFVKEYMSKMFKNINFEREFE